MSILKGHQLALIGQGYQLALTPDERCLIYTQSVMEENAWDNKASSVVHLLDAETLTVRRTWELPESWINSAACSSDGTQVALGCGWTLVHDSEMRGYSMWVDRTVRLLRLPGGPPATQLDVEGIVQGVAFSTQHLAVLRQDRLGLRPRSAPKREHLAVGRQEEQGAPPVRIPLAVCGHPRRDLFATGDAEGFVRLLEASTGEYVAVFPSSLGGPISVLQFDPAGQLLAAGLADGRLALMDARDGACLQTLTGPGKVASLSFDCDSRWLAVVREGQVRLHSLPGGELVGEFHGWAAAVSQNRRLFVAGDAGVERHLF